MIDSRFKDDLIEIADKLGYEEQSMQLIEEMAELTQAISKYRRYNDTEELLDLIEELCDVNIVLEQVIYLLSKKIKDEINDDLLKYFNDDVKYKINRTKRRIEKTGKNSSKH